MAERYGNYIDGAWVDGAHDFENRNPSAIDEVIGLYAQASADQVRAACVAAEQAQQAWAHSAIQERADLLYEIAERVLAQQDSLADLIAREQGRPLHEARLEVRRAVQVFRFFAGEALRLSGERLDSVRPGVEVELRREPVGVVAMITPWNVPLGIPVWKIAPALAYGNSVVLKPSELVPGTAWALARIIADTNLPAGVFNLVMGTGAETGALLLEAPEVDAVSFTGSVATGRIVAMKCAETGKKVQMEMGGKNPLLVLDDADLEVAVEAALDGAFLYTGQRCTASSRLVATSGIHDRFVDALQTRLQAIRVGHALDEETQIGPVIDQRQLEKNLSYVEIARKEGGEVFGGGLLERPTQGYYMAPALVTGTHNAMRINQEEVFGPLASVIQVKDYDEGLSVVRDTAFGLSSGICTRSLKYASHFKRHARSGVVTVNLSTSGADYHVPFGGMKASSYGPREQGRNAVEFYTNIKTAYTRP